MLQDTSAQVVYGGSKDFEGTVDPARRKRGLELTILELDKEHWDDDTLMKGCVSLSHAEAPSLFICFFSIRELFGPFLPILPVDDVDEAIRFVNSKCVMPALSNFSAYSLDNKESGFGPICVYPQRRN